MYHNFLNFLLKEDYRREFPEMVKYSEKDSSKNFKRKGILWETKNKVQK